jgi:hypothetical protein
VTLAESTSPGRSPHGRSGMDQYRLVGRSTICSPTGYGTDHIDVSIRWQHTQREMLRHGQWHPAAGRFEPEGAFPSVVLLTGASNGDHACQYEPLVELYEVSFLCARLSMPYSPDSSLWSRQHLGRVQTYLLLFQILHFAMMRTTTPRSPMRS